MELQAHTRKIDPDVTVVHLAGKLTFVEADALNSLIRVLLDRGEKRLILELSRVREIDSLGGTTLIHCFFEARGLAGGLCVAGASPAVTRMFQRTEVDTLIPFFPTVTAACEHFGHLRKSGAETA